MLTRVLVFLLLSSASLLAQTTSTYEIVRVEASPEKGFHWTYFLGIPVNRVTPTHMLVESNNTGSPTDDRAYTEENARLRVVVLMSPPLSQLGSPAIVPAFPRPASNSLMYTHALDRDTLLTRTPNLERLDRQLLAMIEDAKSRLSARGIPVEKKVFIWGYSASGTFAIRFALLQPEILQAVSFGGCSAPPVPAAEYRGRALRYPNGTADYEQIAGRPFNDAAFRAIPIYAYRGDQDTNDEVAYSDGYDEPDRQLIYELFGPTPYPYLRYPKFESLYQQAGVKTRFLIQPGTGHSYGDMAAETVEFFNRNRGSATPWLRPKPLFNRLYLPVVLGGGKWDTEITLFNNSELYLTGEMRVLPGDGGAPLQTAEFGINPFGRQSFVASKLLSDPSKAGYLVVAADSGFLSARSRFITDGLEVFSQAGAPARHGAVASLDTSENSALVLLNPGNRAANVTLWARDAAGSDVATARLSLKPGARMTGTAAQVFGKAVPETAAWLRFYADSPIVVSVFNAPSGVNAVDVLPGTSVYLR